MKVFRWIFFLPIGIFSGFVAKLLWECAITFLERFEIGVITQWLDYGIGEFIGVAAFLYISIKIVPSKKKLVGFILCTLGIIIGILTISYLTKLLITFGSEKIEPEMLRDLIKSIIGAVVEIVSCGVIAFGLHLGRFKNLLAEEGTQVSLSK